MDFPGNSHTSKIAEPEPAKSETTPDPARPKKVVKGRVAKKTIGGRFKQMFVNDGGSFVDSVIQEMIVPMLKEIVVSVITQSADNFRQGIEQRLFGEVRPRTPRTTAYGTGRPTVNYTRYSSTPPTRVTARPAPVQRIVRRSNVVQDIVLASREDADAVIEELDAVIASVGHCTVGDLYSIFDIAPESTDEGWGWVDLRGYSANYIPGSNPREYMLRMPRPIFIEN